MELAKSVRAKFLCIEKGETGYQTGSKQSKVILQPVTGGSDENKQFWQWTPTGKIELSMINHAAANQFEVGKEYYVDFTNPDDYKLVEATVETLKPMVSEQDLLIILAKNNKQLVEAIEKEKAAKGNKCPDFEQAIRNVGVESGEALMLVKLIQYLNGEKKLDELA
ncbi:hypothetical protein V7114_20535 [Neobacillus niacini]|uniref:hypothetical protein n=1 Tax=Neobacillus niacini TaxID=86668 RepID=UPI002FFDCF08